MGLLDGEGFDYHPTGALLHQGGYRIDAPDGEHVWLAADGSPLDVVTITTGSGPWRAYHPSGALAEEGAWLGYRRDGAWLAWDTSARLVARVTWRRGERVAAWLVRGGLVLEGGYVDGLRSGTWSAYDEDGALAWRGDYDAGSRIGTWTIGRATLTFADDEPIAVERAWPSGAPRELRDGARFVALWPDASVLEDTPLVDGAIEPPPDASDDGVWERALDLQGWLLADPSPSGDDLMSTIAPADERASPRLALGLAPEPAQRDVAPAEGGTNERGEPDGEWTYFHDNGVRSEAGAFADGVRVGTWRGWDRDGRPTWQATYMADRLEGAWRTFRREGGALVTGTYEAGRRVGTWTWYHPDGRVATVGAYLDDRAEGPWRGTHPNGLPAWQGRYSAGRRTGTWVFYAPDGRELRRADYLDDRELRRP